MDADGVVLPYWPDRPPLEALEVAANAEASGARELWVGEMATFDAFAVAGAIAARTSRITLTVGPLAVAVRDPVALALGISSVSEIGGRTANLALGVSTPVVVSGWHGREWSGSLARLRETVETLRPMLDGRKQPFNGTHVTTSGFRLRTEPPRSPITVAAFAPGSVRAAEELADRMVINLVTPEQAARLKGSTPLAAWVVAAIDPDDATLDQIRGAVLAYLAAPGYGEMFTDAGFGELVAAARAGAHPRELAAAIPRALLESVAAIGSENEVRARLRTYRDAGVDHIAIVPATANDPGAARTIASLCRAY